MIEDIEKNSNKSLADNEIASLMKTLASKNFRENVSFPKKVIQPFKPISFFEAANKNLEKPDDSISKNIEEIELAKENVEKQIAEGEREASDQIESNNEKLDEVQMIELGENDSNLDDSQNKNELNETEKTIDNSVQELPNSIGIPVKENLYTNDELKQEYERGYLEGVEEEQRKITSEIGSSIKSFDNIIKAIEEKIFIDTKLLEKHIKDEIIKITTERVGLLINEMPEDFLKKIKLLSNSILKSSEKRVFKLNPEDLEIVKKISQDKDSLEKFVFLADNSLTRGDCIIEIGEISLEDKIIDRYGSSEENTRYFEYDSSENQNEETSQLEKDTKNTNSNTENSNVSKQSEGELLNTEISKSEEVQEKNNTPNISELSENKNTNIESSPKDQAIEEPKSSLNIPDISSDKSENTNLAETTENTSKKELKNQDKT